MGICVSCRRRERKAPEKRSVPGAGGPAKGAAAAELLPRRSDRLPTMANSMSNIKMTNPIKGMVSKRRRRYQKDGFNLDLAYITDRLIAMGFPAEKLEGVYRNHIDEVYRFLEKMHKDRYKIYNLCSERSYDSSKFHERVVRYAFEDHMPPEIEIIQPFCEDVHKWLSADPKNVAAVHCKAGKGRTGTMVCCYLLYSGQKTTADEALKFYGTKRTHDEKGVTIPSQRRYVEYYAALLRSGLRYTPTKVHIRELVMIPAPTLNGGHCAPELTVTQAKPSFKTPSGCHETVRSESCVRVRLTHCTPLCGDVRVDVYNKPKMKMRKEKLFHFWFNTFFVTAELGADRVPPLLDSPNLDTFKLTLNKWQLDDAHKDKTNKHYSQDFRVELIIQKLPESSTFSGQEARVPPPSPPSSASSCSDGDADAHWDSGELPYSRLADLTPPEAHLATLSDLAQEATYPAALSDLTHDPSYPAALSDHTHEASFPAALSDRTREASFPAALSDRTHEASFAAALSNRTREAIFPAALSDLTHTEECPGYGSAALSNRTPCATELGYKSAALPIARTECAPDCRYRASLSEAARYRPECPADCLDLKYSPDDEPMSESDDVFYRLSAPSEPSDPFYVSTNSSTESNDAFLLPERKSESGFGDSDYYKLSTNSKETSDAYYKISTNGKKAEGTAKARSSLGDFRASWRGFSGKFSDRKKKDDS